MREKILFTISLILMSVCSMFAQSAQNDGEWNTFIESMITVESRGVTNARNGNCVGVLQMMPVCVKAVNNVCKLTNNGKKFTNKDRYSREKSIEMFKILQDYYNPTHDFRKACNLWNAGSVNVNCGRYYNRVMKVYDRLNSHR